VAPKRLFIVHVAAGVRAYVHVAAAKTSRTDVKRSALNYIAFPWRIDGGMRCICIPVLCPARCTKTVYRVVRREIAVTGLARSREPRSLRALAASNEITDLKPRAREFIFLRDAPSRGRRICIWAAISGCRRRIFTRPGKLRVRLRIRRSRNSHAPCRPPRHSGGRGANGSGQGEREREREREKGGGGERDEHTYRDRPWTRGS